jgi:hypothetical protein
MNTKHAAAILLLAAVAPFAAQAGSVRNEVKSDLADARAEVRADMAKERAELENGNLTLDRLHFGKDRKSSRQEIDRPEGEITPTGDFLVDGKPVAIDAAQRAQLVAYRSQVIDLAKLGLDAGERAAMLAIDATDVGMVRLFFSAMTGSLERKVKDTVAREIKPAVLQICRRLPDLRASQQQLAASLPEFRPYATIEERDVADCERDVRDEFATL